MKSKPARRGPVREEEYEDEEEEDVQQRFSSTPSPDKPRGAPTVSAGKSAPKPKMLRPPQADTLAEQSIQESIKFEPEESIGESISYAPSASKRESGTMSRQESVEKEKPAIVVNRPSPPNRARDPREETIGESIDQYSEDFNSATHSQSLQPPSAQKRFPNAQKKDGATTEEDEIEYSANFEEESLQGSAQLTMGRSATDLPKVDKYKERMELVQEEEEEDEQAAEEKRKAEEEKKEQEQQRLDEQRTPSPDRRLGHSVEGLKAREDDENISESIMEESIQSDMKAESQEKRTSVMSGLADEERKFGSSLSSEDVEVFGSHRSVDWVVDVERASAQLLKPIKEEEHERTPDRSADAHQGKKPFEIKEEKKESPKEEEEDEIEESIAYSNDFEEASEDTARGSQKISPPKEERKKSKLHAELDSLRSVNEADEEIAILANKERTLDHLTQYLIENVFLKEIRHQLIPQRTVLLGAFKDKFPFKRPPAQEEAKQRAPSSSPSKRQFQGFNTDKEAVEGYLARLRAKVDENIEEIAINIHRPAERDPLEVLRKL